jgi:hypothetical protein
MKRLRKRKFPVGDLYPGRNVDGVGGGPGRCQGGSADKDNYTSLPYYCARFKKLTVLRVTGNALI